MGADSTVFDAPGATDTVTSDGWIVVEPGRIEVKEVWPLGYRASRWKYQVPFKTGQGWMTTSPRFITRDTAIKAARKVLS